MEDISRELEREIARAKPTPYKSRTKRRILIVDDFGELRSGGYLKVLVYIFALISVVGVLGTAGFYYLFTSASQENRRLKEHLAAVEKKSDRLTKDKEILMARLVIAGEKPELPAPEEKVQEPPPAKAKQPGIMPKPASEEETVDTVENLAAAEAHEGVSPDVPEAPVPLSASKADEALPVDTDQEPVVSVEKFSVVQGAGNGQLVVKFNIRNITEESKEISGRIFAVLKPENAPETDWVVVPNASMEEGVPTPYRKGQYFSISRFKPVRFTIKNQATPESFKTASVYIFSDEGDLLFKRSIVIDKDDGGQ